MATFSNPFDSLPIETNQHIASFLEYDKDVDSFRRICRSTFDAVDADNCTFWRRRFLTCFDNPRWPPGNNERYKFSYRSRRKLLKYGAQFGAGDSDDERYCLELLRDLMAESFSGTTNHPDRIHESLNLQQIKRFLLATNLLQTVCKPKSSKQSTIRYTSTRRAQPVRTYTDARPTDLLITIQVLCAALLLSFEPHISTHNYNFPDSQAAVYSTASQWPIFTGTHGLDVNMPFILHNLNFWKYHMVREHEQTLFHPFQDLDPDERPRWWSAQLKQGGEKQLGKHWKGSYAYMERPDVEALRRRRGEPTADQFQDSFAGEETACSFQDMQLHLPNDSHTTIWPEAFERHLQSLTPPPSRAKTRAQKRCATPDAIANFRPQSFRFDGEGQDVTEIFNAMGWLNPLPPQQGVPGWQRMTMMKYFDDESDPSGVDLNALWAYEGVVLPGGQIVLGRWWSPNEVDEEMYSGPFILWCVDGPKYDDAEVEAEMEGGGGGWADPIESAFAAGCS